MSVNVSADLVLICSFCGKSRFEVELLIKGNDAFICDECVNVCVEIVQDPNV
jgi:ATP-dependent Clp protease ATP-binding subunit ClpX